MVISSIKEFFGYDSKTKKPSIIDIKKEKILDLITEAGSDGISNLRILNRIGGNDFNTAEALFQLELEDKIKIMRYETRVIEGNTFIERFYTLP